MSASEWKPPRPLLVSGSAGSRVPKDGLTALAAATDLVELSMISEALVPAGVVQAVEVTVRHGDRARAATARLDATARDRGLASFTVQEPSDEMMAEDLPALTRRFVRALLDCLAVGAREGTLDPAKVEAVRRGAEEEASRS